MDTILMRPLTAAEVAATAAERFRSQYSDWDSGDRFADGKSKQDVDDAFNTMAHTPENVAKALNGSWAYPKCSCCNRRFMAVVRMKQPWGDEVFDICVSCVERAARMFDGVDYAEVSTP
jgi:hypothetical protein